MGLLRAVSDLGIYAVPSISAPTGVLPLCRANSSRCMPDSCDDAEVALPMKKAVPKPITVAIVEDDARIRRSLAAILARADGVKCVGEFPSGEAAIAQLPGLKPRIVLMDVNLPGMDGVECVRKLASQLPETQFVMLTIHQDSETIFQSLSAGASGYLLKPPSAPELIAAVHDVFTGGAPMNSMIARKLVEWFKKSEQAAPPSSETESLSPREIEVLELLTHGFAYKEIANKLSVTYSTVQTYIERIYKKLHVRSRSHAVAKFLGGS
jgi:DNA-binding NarL/FixJ family response regulator